jgi:anti-sigma factor RsiW
MRSRLTFSKSGTMTRAKDKMEETAAFEAGHDLWQRCRASEVPEGDTERFLDLAAMADGTLDEEEHERIAERLALDPVARADVATARAHGVGGIAMPGGIEAIIERAIAILDEAAPDPIVTAAALPRGRAMLQTVAQWGSLAAAIAFASWLGFAMGTGVSETMTQPRSVSQISDENSMPELLDPSTGFLRDLGMGQQT